MPAHDPTERALWARHAALSRWSKESGKANAQRGQDGLLKKFYAQTDPGLPEAERWRRAECLRQAHMVKLSARSVQARRVGGVDAT